MLTPMCRSLVAVLTALSLLVVVGCSSSDEPTAGEQDAASLSEESTETPPFRLGDLLLESELLHLQVDRLLLAVLRDEQDSPLRLPNRGRGPVPPNMDTVA